ncbi:MAG: sigma-70 family RNA polymerase sigma factor [Clostridia bacterium]|nr:sigma-70 family RNA polymerase sigma factor [Clostridia bacterium]
MTRKYNDESEGTIMNDQTVYGVMIRNEKTFESIMNTFGNYVATIIYNVSKGTLTKEDIEETTADVFITLWKNAEKVQQGKLKSYIGCIAKTRALNKVDSVRNKAVINIEDYELEDDFSISDETEKNDITKEVRRIVDALTEPDREILIRFYYYYQTASEIAEIMDMNKETVKTRLRRTREKIKITLTERGYAL